MIQLPPNIGEFFTFIASNAALGFVVSLMMFHWLWFQNQPSGTKVVLLVIVAVGMGWTSQLLITYTPAGVVAAAEPYYKSAVNALMILGGTQIWHYLVNLRQDGQPDTTFIQGSAATLLPPDPNWFIQALAAALMIKPPMPDAPAKATGDSTSSANPGQASSTAAAPSPDSAVPHTQAG